MKKFAICITETLQRTVIVEVNDNETYEDAEKKIYEEIQRLVNSKKEGK